jgi:DAACS family dicarboxylate/amino acid:cation (Na+ or H+) symporter
LVVLGIALALFREKGRAIADFLESTFTVLQKVISLVLALAPYGVVALLFAMTARFGPSDLLVLLPFVATVIAGLLFHHFVVYWVLLRFLARVSTLEFYRRIRTVITTAFATSSSSATLPTALGTAEERLHLPREVSTFTLTVGANTNQSGTAVGVTVVFLAQVAQSYGILGDLTPTHQLKLLGFAILAGLATPGVPSTSLFFIVLALLDIDLEPTKVLEGIAMIFGVD